MSNEITIDSMYPSKYLKAGDLSPRRGLTVTIDAVEQEQLGDEDKWIIYFVEPGAKPMVLNKTNATAIADTYGKKVVDWTGQKIHLRVEKVAFQGKRVDAVRVAPLELNDDISNIGKADNTGAAA